MKESFENSEDNIINSLSSNNDNILDKINDVNLDTTNINNSKKSIIPNIEKMNQSIINDDIIINKNENENIKAVELSKDCFIGPNAAPSNLLKDIANIDIVTTLEPLLTVRKSCFKKLSVEDILSWQKKEISSPLLRMEDEDDIETAKQMFRNLLSYMGDRKSSKEQIKHARKYVNLVLSSNNDIIRDEAYLQVYKQLHENSKIESLVRGWKIMAIISSCFVPKNEDIYNIILHFLFYEMQNSSDEKIVKYSKYIFVRMIKTKAKERHHVPCEEEIGCIERLASIVVPVKFFNGTHANINIESYTTIKELKSEIMNKLDFHVQKSIYYSIYEICEKKEGTEERFIDDAEKVCDILSVWNNEIESEKAKGEHCKFHFYLKLLIYYPYDKDDIETISVIYYQTVYDVISGKHPVTEQNIINLASYQLVVEFKNNQEAVEKSLKDSLNSYIPTNKINLLTAKEWEEKILEQYNNVNKIKKNEAKWEYIQELKDLPTYQVQQFNAKFNENKSGTNDDNIPEYCIIGLKPDGISILDREHNEVVFYKYESLMNWGISRNQLILSISFSLSQVKRICFFTSQTKVIQALIEIYCNMLVGKTVKDIQEVINNYDKKFEKIDSSRIMHSLILKDVGGKLYENKKDEDVLGINTEENNDENKVNDNKDNVNNSNNMPLQPIPPMDDE